MHAGTPHCLEVRPRQTEKAPSDSVLGAVQTSFYHHTARGFYLGSYLVTVDCQYITRGEDLSNLRWEDMPHDVQHKPLVYSVRTWTDFQRRYRQAKL